MTNPMQKAVNVDRSDHSKGERVLRHIEWDTVVPENRREVFLGTVDHENYHAWLVRQLGTALITNEFSTEWENKNEKYAFYSNMGGFLTRKANWHGNKYDIRGLYKITVEYGKNYGDHIKPKWLVMGVNERNQWTIIGSASTQKDAARVAQIFQKDYYHFSDKYWNTLPKMRMLPIEVRTTTDKIKGTLLHNQGTNIACDSSCTVGEPVNLRNHGAI